MDLVLDKHLMALLHYYCYKTRYNILNYSYRCSHSTAYKMYQLYSPQLDKPRVSWHHCYYYSSQSSTLHYPYMNYHRAAYIQSVWSQQSGKLQPSRLHYFCRRILNSTLHLVYMYCHSVACSWQSPGYRVDYSSPRFVWQLWMACRRRSYCNSLCFLCKERGGLNRFYRWREHLGMVHRCLLSSYRCSGSNGLSNSPSHLYTLDRTDIYMAYWH